MSSNTHFPLFSSIGRRIGEKLGSKKNKRIKIHTVEDWIRLTEEKIPKEEQCKNNDY